MWEIIDEWRAYIEVLEAIAESAGYNFIDED
jgi:hypothetical protein